MMIKNKTTYNKLFLITLIVLTVFVASAGYVLGQSVEDVLDPPTVDVFSENISNEDIFYIGGRVGNPSAKVVIFLQNEDTGETLGFTVEANDEGEWLYRHSNFLSEGSYTLWTQSRIESEVSPPSPQLDMSVKHTALQFGASRLSYKTLLVFSTAGLGTAFFLLLVYILFHLYHGRQKQQDYLRKLEKVERSIHHGLMVIKKDINKELAAIDNMKKDARTDEIKRREKELLEDLMELERHIDEDFIDLENLGHIH